MYNRTWKRTVILTGLVLLALVYLILQPGQQEPAMTPVLFLFIFIAFVTLFPPSISQAQPDSLQKVSRFQKRAPPLR